MRVFFKAIPILILMLAAPAFGGSTQAKSVEAFMDLLNEIQNGLNGNTVGKLIRTQVDGNTADVPDQEKDLAKVTQFVDSKGQLLSSKKSKSKDPYLIPRHLIALRNIFYPEEEDKDKWAKDAKREAIITRLAVIAAGALLNPENFSPTSEGADGRKNFVDILRAVYRIKETTQDDVIHEAAVRALGQMGKEYLKNTPGLSEDRVTWEKLSRPAGPKKKAFVAERPIAPSRVYLPDPREIGKKITGKRAGTRVDGLAELSKLAVAPEIVQSHWDVLEPGLLATLRDKDPEVREAALEALKPFVINSRGLPLSIPHWWSRSKALQTAFIENAMDPNDGIRSLGRELVSVGQNAKKMEDRVFYEPAAVEGVIVPLLRSNDPGDALRALDFLLATTKKGEAIPKWFEESAKIQRALVDLNLHENPELQTRAAKLVLKHIPAKIFLPEERVLDGVIAMLHKGNLTAKTAAIQMLARSRSTLHHKIETALADILEEPSADERLKAAVLQALDQRGLGNADIKTDPWGKPLVGDVSPDAANTVARLIYDPNLAERDFDKQNLNHDLRLLAARVLIRSSEELRKGSRSSLNSVYTAWTAMLPSTDHVGSKDQELKLLAKQALTELDRPWVHEDGEKASDKIERLIRRRDPSQQNPIRVLVDLCLFQ